MPDIIDDLNLVARLTEQAEVYVGSLGNLCRDAVNAITDLRKENKRLAINLKDCRNELCLRCDNYHEAYNGACDGCRWRGV